MVNYDYVKSTALRKSMAVANKSSKAQIKAWSTFKKGKKK